MLVRGERMSDMMAAIVTSLQDTAGHKTSLQLPDERIGPRYDFVVTLEYSIG
jgi:hypothetical protein